MEILSTGDKIKRARVYEGITLKELCEDKISISKMSCIENGKIEPDKDIMEHISKKLKLDYNYLIQDVRDQIRENIKIIEHEQNKDTIDKLEYLLDYALKYEYYDLAFSITHKLFNYYITKNTNDDLEIIISTYYDLFQKNISKDNTLIYFNDMAGFFYEANEYLEAVNYYLKIMEILEYDKEYKSALYITNCYNLGLAYMKIGELEKSYESLKKAVENVEFIKDKIKKGELYSAFSQTAILLNKSNNEEFIIKANECLKDNVILLSNSKSNIGKSYFEVGETVKGKDCVYESINLLKTNNDGNYLQALINAIDIFYNNKEFDLVMEMADEALNLSICLNDTKLIERSYYFKGMVLQQKGLFLQAETYMNIAIDYYLKEANNKDTYIRYTEMAELYYNLGELRESLKYFTLAMNIKRD